MSSHLRLLSAAHRPPAPVSAPTSLHRPSLPGPPPPPPPPAARLRLLLRPPRLGGSQARFARVVRCAGEASAVARAGEDGDGDDAAAAAAGIWEQARDIVVFAGPALGLWICGPLMSLIDTMVIGQTSALQLAALGPGTVFCDYLSYIFMFLSVATSNMVATSLAKKNIELHTTAYIGYYLAVNACFMARILLLGTLLCSYFVCSVLDEELAQHQVSMLLFLALACGIGMFLFTKVFGTQVLTAFTGSGNYELISSANTYAQIRGFAWPAVLVGLVAQSASLGMKDSWGPLKALAAASVINGVGDIFLCSVCGYGIAGAAWATMVSQVVAAFMMMQNLSNKGFRAFSFTIPSVRELLQIFEIAAPVFVTMTSKVAFYALLTYSATSMGAITLAAHQVMINVLCMCTVWGEPLSQTAQSFMPELIYGANQNLTKARMLLKSLVIIGAITGLTLGAVGTLVPWLFPSVFTNDQMVVQQMHRVLAPYFSVLLVTPSIHSLEGTLLAGRDLRYLSQSMGVCFSIGTLLLMVLRNKGSLPGCWWILVLFQWSRFGSALLRLISPTGMLFNKKL